MRSAPAPGANRILTKRAIHSTNTKRKASHA
jgi:hypothetical protein